MEEEREEEDVAVVKAAALAACEGGREETDVAPIDPRPGAFEEDEGRREDKEE